MMMIMMVMIVMMMIVMIMMCPSSVPAVVCGSAGPDSGDDASERV